MRTEVCTVRLPAMVDLQGLSVAWQVQFTSFMHQNSERLADLRYAGEMKDFSWLARLEQAEERTLAMMVMGTMTAGT